MDKLRMHSPDLTERNVDRIAELFPTVITESLDDDGNPVCTVDFDLLRQELSDHIVEGPQERYQLDWPGKREALFAANAPIAKTLRPVREESVNFDTTQNLFIEGDNLDALKLLQESYLGKVKLIYIDPPYNTGNDFVFNDDFAETVGDYLARSGQLDDEGARLVANTQSNGRFHSDWLTMMYPRLKLARNLLQEQGVILVSIDDHEVHNLRRICDEIFGFDNFCGAFIWEKKKKPSFLNRTMGSVTEYIIAYARNRECTAAFIAGEVERGKKYPFNNAGNTSSVLCFPARSVTFLCQDGVVRAQDMSGGNIKTTLLDDVEVVEGTNMNQFRLEGEWRYSQRTLDTFVRQNAEIVISKIPFRPNYISKGGENKKTHNLLSHRLNDIPTNEDASAEMMELFGAKVMSYPKPTGLLRYLVQAISVGDDTIMDFFAGSSSMAHAVMLANVADGGCRRFIMVQLDEETDPKSEAAKAGFATISALSRERIRRAATRIASDTGLVADGLDLGFRATRVETTNMVDVLRTPDNLVQNELDLYTDSVKPDRSGEDLLFQVLLDWGLELTMSIITEQMDGHEVFVVEDGALVACFDEEVSPALVREIAEREPLRAVFRDYGFASDADRINADQVFAEISPSTDFKVI